MIPVNVPPINAFTAMVSAATIAISATSFTNFYIGGIDPSLDLTALPAMGISLCDTMTWGDFSFIGSFTVDFYDLYDDTLDFQDNEVRHYNNIYKLFSVGIRGLPRNFPGYLAIREINWNGAQSGELQSPVFQQSGTRYIAGQVTIDYGLRPTV